MHQAVKLSEEFAALDDLWKHRIVASVNDYDVKVVKVEGEFVWHDHPQTDELFLVTAGALTIELRDDDHGEHRVTLRAGDLFVVPRGVQHRPVAAPDTHIVLFEPQATVNTGG